MIPGSLVVSNRNRPWLTGVGKDLKGRILGSACNSGKDNQVLGRPRIRVAPGMLAGNPHAASVGWCHQQSQLHCHLSLSISAQVSKLVSCAPPP